MRITARVVTVMLVVVFSLAIGSLAPASGAAMVYKAHGDSQCSVDPGDIPGLPGIAFEDATLTIVGKPNGSLLFHCSGALPSGFTVPATREGYLPCYASDTAMVPAHYVITKGGRIEYTCVFPAGSI